MMFRHRLALALGMTISEMNLRMSAGELNQWRAFERLAPFGDIRADLRNGVLCTIVSNALGGRSRPGDYILEFDPNEKQMTSEDIMGQLRAYAMVHGDVYDRYGRKVN